MRTSALVASIILGCGLILGIIAASTNHWSNSASGTNSDIEVGLFQACVYSSPVTLWAQCRTLDRSTSITFLTALGDTDPGTHYDMFNAARIIFIISLGLTLLAAILALAFSAVDLHRGVLAVPIISLVAAGIMCVLTIIFWGVFHNDALTKVPDVDLKLGWSWILAIIYFALQLLALIFLMVACINDDTVWVRRGDGVTKTTVVAGGGGTTTVMDSGYGASAPVAVAPTYAPYSVPVAAPVAAVPVVSAPMNMGIGGGRPATVIAV